MISHNVSQHLLVCRAEQGIEHIEQGLKSPECSGFCGSIALPISREPDRYSEQEHRMDAMSELGCSAVPNFLWSFVVMSFAG